jgi:nucleotide-binding universal stress UspA family protein
MSIKSILVHIDASPDSRARLGLARDLAERFGARLVGACAATLSDTVLLMGGLPPGLLAEHETQLKNAIGAQHRRFSKVAHGVPSEWRAQIASPRDFLGRTACIADLVVVGRAAAEAAGEEFHLAPADAVMAVGRPVLVVPPGVESLSADSVVVAWKTGRTAALAVQLALPILQRAGRVFVLGVGEETSHAELDDVRDHLVRHGVSAQAQWRGLSGEAADRAIVDATLELGADLIVCGAYGRSQLFEWALGGVTQGLLANSPFCCLMVH